MVVEDAATHNSTQEKCVLVTDNIIKINDLDSQNSRATMNTCDTKENPLNGAKLYDVMTQENTDDTCELAYSFLAGIDEVPLACIDHDTNNVRKGNWVPPIHEFTNKILNIQASEKYFEDILLAHKVTDSGLPNIYGCRIPVKSNWNLELFSSLLVDYHDKKVVDWLRYGLNNSQRRSGTGSGGKQHESCRCIELHA